MVWIRDDLADRSADQSPDRLDMAVAGLGLAELAVRLRRAGRFDRIHGVGLAFARRRS